MQEIRFHAVSVARQVRHKPDELRITTRQGEKTKCFSVPTKISEKSIKRRCNDTLQLQECAINSGDGENVRIHPEGPGFLFEVMTKGGQTDGRRKQHYILLQRNAAYCVNTTRDDEYVVSVDLVNPQDEILNLWNGGAPRQPVEEPPSMWQKAADVLVKFANGNMHLTNTDAHDFLANLSGAPSFDLRSTFLQHIPQEFSAPLVDAANFFEQESEKLATKSVSETLSESSEERWDSASSDELSSSELPLTPSPPQESWQNVDGYFPPTDCLDLNLLNGSNDYQANTVEDDQLLSQLPDLMGSFSRTWSTTSETSLYSAQSTISETTVSDPEVLRNSLIGDAKRKKARFVMNPKLWETSTQSAPFWVSIVSPEDWSGPVEIKFGGSVLADIYLSSKSVTFAVPTPPANMQHQAGTCVEVDVEVSVSGHSAFFTQFTYSFGSSAGLGALKAYKKDDDNFDDDDDDDENRRSKKRSKFAPPVRLFTTFNSLSAVFQGVFNCPDLQQGFCNMLQACFDRSDESIRKLFTTGTTFFMQSPAFVRYALLDVCQNAIVTNALDEVDSEGFALLHYVCALGLPNFTHLLCRKGANPNIHSWCTPLDVALAHSTSWLQVDCCLEDDENAQFPQAVPPKPSPSIPQSESLPFMSPSYFSQQSTDTLSTPIDSSLPPNCSSAMSISSFSTTVTDQPNHDCYQSKNIQEAACGPGSRSSHKNTTNPSLYGSHKNTVLDTVVSHISVENPLRSLRSSHKNTTAMSLRSSHNFVSDSSSMQDSSHKNTVHSTRKLNSTNKSHNSSNVNLRGKRKQSKNNSTTANEQGCPQLDVLTSASCLHSLDGFAAIATDRVVAQTSQTQGMPDCSRSQSSSALDLLAQVSLAAPLSSNSRSDTSDCGPTPGVKCENVGREVLRTSDGDSAKTLTQGASSQAPKRSRGKGRSVGRDVQQCSPDTPSGTIQTRGASRRGVSKGGADKSTLDTQITLSGVPARTSRRGRPLRGSVGSDDIPNTQGVKTQTKDGSSRACSQGGRDKRIGRSVTSLRISDTKKLPAKTKAAKGKSVGRDASHPDTKGAKTKTNDMQVQIHQEGGVSHPQGVANQTAVANAWEVCHEDGESVGRDVSPLHTSDTQGLETPSNDFGQPACSCPFHEKCQNESFKSQAKERPVGTKRVNAKCQQSAAKDGATLKEEATHDTDRTLLILILRQYGACTFKELCPDVPHEKTKRCPCCASLHVSTKEKSEKMSEDPSTNKSGEKRSKKRRASDNPSTWGFLRVRSQDAKRSWAKEMQRRQKIGLISMFKFKAGRPLPPRRSGKKQKCKQDVIYEQQLPTPAENHGHQRDMSTSSSQNREVSDQDASTQNFSQPKGIVSCAHRESNAPTVSSLVDDLQQPFQHSHENDNLARPEMKVGDQQEQQLPQQTSLQQRDLVGLQDQLQQQLQIELNRCYQQQQSTQQQPTHQQPTHRQHQPEQQREQLFQQLSPQQQHELVPLEERQQRQQFVENNKNLLPFLNSPFAQQLLQLQNYVPQRRLHDIPCALELGGSPRKKVPRARCSALLVGPSRKILGFQERIRHQLSQFGFPSFITLQDDEATVERVLQQLRHLSGQSGSRDRVVVYFCGSGSQLGVSLVDGWLLYPRLATILQSFETPNLCLVLDVEELQMLSGL